MRKFFILIMVIFVAFFTEVYASERNISLENSFNNSVFMIFNEDNLGNYTWGTGFFINNQNYAITNYHVVKDNHNLYIGVMRDKKIYKAKVVKFDETLDLAMLYVDGINTYNYISFDSSTNYTGTTYTLGFPQNNDTKLPKYTSTTGNVIEENVLYKDNYYTRINNNVCIGNSGGPTLNIDNKCIGIITKGKTNDTYIIPASKVLEFINNANNTIDLTNKTFATRTIIPFQLKKFLV